MKLFNKFISFMSAAIMTVSAVSFSFANAATDFTEPSPLPNPNTADTNWSVGHDYCRQKFDASSVYVSNTSYYYAKADVYGAIVTVNNGVKSVSENKYVGGSTFSATNVTIPANRKGLIRQNVHENGYSYVHIYFKTYSGTNGGSGKWSPDSYGTYDLLN